MQSWLSPTRPTRGLSASQTHVCTSNSASQSQSTMENINPRQGALAVKAATGYTDESWRFFMVCNLRRFATGLILISQQRVTRILAEELMGVVGVISRGSPLDDPQSVSRSGVLLTVSNAQPALARDTFARESYPIIEWWHCDNQLDDFEPRT